LWLHKAPWWHKHIRARLFARQDFQFGKIAHNNQPNM
jgi:hypothetical protein